MGSVGVNESINRYNPGTVTYNKSNTVFSESDISTLEKSRFAYEATDDYVMDVYFRELKIASIKRLSGYELQLVMPGSTRAYTSMSKLVNYLNKHDAGLYSDAERLARRRGR